MDFVWLRLKRNRGWPWPNESWGLDPMFGDDGWCKACGIPLREQCGSLVLRRGGFAQVSGAWVPNWRFDVICVEASLAARIDERFSVPMRDVAWKGKAPGVARQIVAPTIGRIWFDADELRTRTIARHGVAGAECPECGIWRWMPLSFEALPPITALSELGDADVAASPEWFGDGQRAYRQVILRRALGALIASASPKDFIVNDLPE